MSIYLDEKNPGKHPPFDDASPDIVEYVRYLEVIAGKSANTAFSYYCDLRGFSRFMKRRRGLVPADTEIKDIDPKGLDTAFWGSVSKEDIYEYLYFLNRECGNKKSSTARRLASFGCKLYYYTRHRRPPQVEEDFGVTYLPLEELTAQCDIISLHCAVTDETREMVDGAFLARMKPNSILVNCGRGDLVDNQALRKALIDGTIRGAALDTIFPEPTPGDHPLVDLPPEVRDRVVYSSHLGGSSGGAFAKAHLTMWTNAQHILNGERPTNVVNGL